MRRTAILTAGLALSVALVGCGGDTSSTSPGDEVTPTTAGQPAGEVPAPGELAGMLVTAEALGEGWMEQPPPGDVGVETPGVVPEQEQANLPRIEFCDAASDESREAAEGLRWQAARIFSVRLPESPRDHQVFVQEFLLADEAEGVDGTYAAVAEGIADCAGEETDYGDGTIGRSSLMPAVPLGWESVGVREIVEEPSPRGPATWDLRGVFGHDGPVLVWLQMGEVRVGKAVAQYIDEDMTTSLVEAVGAALG